MRWFSGPVGIDRPPTREYPAPKLSDTETGMTRDITPEVEKMIESFMRTGDYDNESDVLQEA